MARPVSQAPRRRPPFRRVARASFTVLGTTLLFATGTVAGIAIHLDHPAARRLVARTLNNALAPALNGTITIEKIDRIALLSGSVDGVDATIRDAEGHTVIVARWVSARIALLPLLRSLVDGPLVVRLDRVRIEGVDVTLRDDANGVSSLATAFLPRDVSQPGEPAGPPGKEVVLAIDDVAIRHAWAHGTLGAQPVDLEADRLSGVLRVDPTEFSAVLRPLVFHARALPIPAGVAEGSVEGVISIPFETMRRTTARVSVLVRIGELSATAQGNLHGESFRARVEVPKARGRALDAVVAGVPLLAPVGARFDVEGTWERARVKGRVDVGDGHTEIVGGVAWTDGLAAELTAKVAHLSLSESFVGAPPGIIDAEIEAGAIVASGGELSAVYGVRTAATVIDGQAVPAIVTTGTFDGERVVGEAMIAEPGAPTTAAYVLAPEDQRPGIHGLDVDVRTEIGNLWRAPRLGRTLEGAARARVQGHLTLDDGLALEAVVTASAARLRVGSVTISGASATATWRGTARSPTVHGTAWANDVHAAGLLVKRTTVSVDGELLAPRVHVAAESHDGDTLVASAKVFFGRTTTVSGVDARLVRNREEVLARVASVRVGPSGTAVDGISVRGAGGSLDASVSTGPGMLRAKVVSTAIDLGRFRVLLGPSVPAFSGTATVDVDLVATPTSASGYVRIAARDAALGSEVHGAQLDGEVLFDGRAVALRALASVPKVGAVLITSDGARLGGSVLATSSYRTATGAMNAVVVADLARVAALLPEGRLPLEHIAGEAIVTARASRRDESIPELSVGVTTVGLELATKTQDGVVGTSVQGVELALSGNRDPRTGWIALDAFASDARGELAELHVAARPSVEALFSAPDSLREELLRTEFALMASAPRRDFQHLPGALQWTGVRGTAAVELLASGTARDPSATVSVRANDVAVDGQGRRQAPFGVRLDATFANGRGSTTAQISSKGRAVLVARGNGTFQFADLADGRTDGPRWSAGGDIALSALPLHALPFLAGQRIRGCVSGTFALRGLHDDAMLDAEVGIEGLRIGRVSFRSAKARAHAGAGMATVDARLVQDDGELTARGSVGIEWGSALTPSLNVTREAEGRVRAQGLHLAALRPFVRDFLGNVDGLLDADLRYRQRPSDHAGVRLEGEASVRDGVVDAPLLGQELRAIRAKLTISPAGELRLRDASAEGISGRVVVDATAHLDKLALRDASATMRIAQREAMSLTYEGVELGSAWGDVDITAARAANGVTTVDVAIPRFYLELPEAPARSTQNLDDEPTIQVGTHTDQRFVSLRQGPPPTSPAPLSVETASQPPSPAANVVVRVVLGREVRVYRTNSIDAWLTGKVQAVMQSDRTAVSGAVQVERGFVEIQGRRFSIERATASFDPARAPGDPTVTATAAYDAPDATRIFADYAGTAETGKLRLYSEPALTQPEILSLIVFGTREGGEGSRGGSTGGEAAAAAASVGGGVATQGINKALADITPVEITTRVDTSDSQDPRPEVAVAISSKVSATVWYRLGLPMPGDNPDRSMLRLDYRFHPRWVLETSVGDKGTSIVDLIWKMRY